MENYQQKLTNPIITWGTGLIIGILFGLIVLGWGIWPVQWVDAAPGPVWQTSMHRAISIPASLPARRNFLSGISGTSSSVSSGRIARILSLSDSGKNRPGSGAGVAIVLIVISVAGDAGSGLMPWTGIFWQRIPSVSSREMVILTLRENKPYPGCGSVGILEDALQADKKCHYEHDPSDNTVCFL